MADQSLGEVVLGDPQGLGSIAPIASVAIAAGTPCYINSSGQAVPAIATAVATSQVVGVAVAPAAAGAPVYLKTGGGVNLGTAQWDAIVTGESGGLTTGSVYYLSAATAGFLTKTAPVSESDVDLQVGIALSPESMLVQIRQQLTLG
jgi:hypothetical protein